MASTIAQPPSSVERDQSRITEGELLNIFLEKTKYIEPERVAVPNNFPNDVIEDTLSKNGYTAEVGGFNGPDYIGESDERVHILEAKAGKKFSNNSKHDLVDVLIRNVHSTKPSESGIIIPRDLAHKFWTRLSNKNESFKDKLGLDGIELAIKGIQREHTVDVNFSVYIVWDTVERLDFVEFIKSGDTITINEN